MSSALRNYSRADLEELKRFDGAGVYAALGSFDERGLADDAFVVRAAQLLDGERVPGLAEAGDVPAAILDAVFAACSQRGTAPLQWSVRDDEVRAAASYDLGYGEDNGIAVEHQREIVFVQERFWVVFDRVVGEGTHRIESRFQFAPGPLRLDGDRVLTAHDDANLLLWPMSTVPYTDVGIEEGEEDPRSGWYSPRYGLLEPAPCLSLKVEQPLPFFAVTLLYPFTGSERPDVAFSVEGASANVRTPGAEAVSIDSQLT